MKLPAAAVFLAVCAFPQARTAAPVQQPLSITNTGFADRLALTVGAFGVPQRQQPRPGARQAPALAYPVYVGGYYGGFYDAPQPTAQPQYAPAQQQPPTVIINQTFNTVAPPPAPSSEPVQVYQAPARTESVEAPNANSYYLIAMLDHSIYSAVGYWVDGQTLHYITAGNVHNQASLSLVDRDLTERLNKDRDSKIILPR